jgi:hypothetical protein
VGVATFGPNLAEPATLLTHAEEALRLVRRQAFEGGKNTRQKHHV